MINSNDLKSFIVTAKNLHLTKAAKELGISQPALSHCIKRLELEVGEELFLRRKNGLILTRAGIYLLSKGQKICNDLTSVSHYLQTGIKSAHQSITLGIHPSVAAYTLPFILKELPKQIDLKFKFGLSKEVSSWIQEGRVDCGLIINPYPHKNLILNHVGNDLFNLWSHKKSYDETRLFFDPQLDQTQSILKQLEKKKVHFEQLVPISNLELIAKLVIEGSGVGILPGKVIKNYHPEITKIYRSDIKPFMDELYFAYSLENKGFESLLKLKNVVKKIIMI
jgi:DNA-binding transcriptional LysR family regulator